MLIPPELEQIQNRLRSRLRDEASISSDSPGSIQDALVIGLSELLKSLWDDLADISRQSNIETAVGTELDAIGGFLGVSRRSARRAGTAGYGPAILFRNTGGTPVTIPLGTAVFPSRQPSLIFRTVSPLSLSAYAVGTVHVEAEASGPEYNVAGNALNAHNAGIPQVTVTNPRAIDSGADVESDESYRTRLYQAIHLRNPGSREAIRLNLAELPDVRDVRILDGIAGPGTFDVLLIPQGSDIPASILLEAENYLAEYAPLGVAWRLRTPKQIPVDITAKLILAPAQEGERANLVATATQTIRNYIDSLSVEEGSGEGEFLFTDFIEQLGFAIPDARDYTVDVTIDERPVIFGANWRPEVGEKLFPNRVRVA